MESPKTLSDTEASMLIKALITPRNRLLGLLLLDAGLRIGEAVQLRKTDLLINTKAYESLYLPPEYCKRCHGRTIPLSNRLQEAIEFIQETRWSLPYYENSPWALWSNARLEPLKVRQARNIINSAGIKAIGRSVNPHMLRHTFATRLMRVTNIRTVQELLGHTNLSSTQIYTHPGPADLKSAIDKIEHVG